jgi:hypothetical protein
MATGFRQLGPEDAEALAGHLITWHRQDGVMLDPAYAGREVRRVLMDNEGWHAWLVEQGGMAVGYLMLSFRRPQAFEAPRANLAALYVVPAARHLNIGRQAHRFVLELGRWLHVQIFECDWAREDRHAPVFARPAARAAFWIESLSRQASA